MMQFAPQKKIMKITGFTFIRNALKYDYPILEAIQSILPICDAFVVAVGNSEDDTLKLIQSIDNQKITIIETVWDDSLRVGGRVLAIETDKAFQAVSADTDWAIYIQGDEVIHEKYLPVIYENMKRYQNDRSVDGLLFNYVHFYGSYDYVGASSGWYDREIRVIRKDKNIYSYKDAQGFRKYNNKKLSVKPIDASVYHYGWVKPPQAMQQKQENFNKYWHDDEWMDKNVLKTTEFDYASNVHALALFTGTHPAVMTHRIKTKNWKFEYDIAFNRTTFKEKFKTFCKRYLGLDFNHKNYKLL
jgi:hypothetical protein